LNFITPKQIHTTFSTNLRNLISDVSAATCADYDNVQFKVDIWEV